MEEVAVIPLVLRRDAGRNLFSAFKPRPRIERLTLHARPQVYAAAIAPALVRDLGAHRVTAPGAADDLREARHVRGAEVARISRAPWLGVLLRAARALRRSRLLPV